MEYLDKVLGIKVTYEDVEFKHLPNFIDTRYRLQMVYMNEQKMIFLYPKTELEQIEAQPLEVVIQQMIQCCFIRPKERPYQTNNAYAALVRQYQMEQEVKEIGRASCRERV